MVSFWYVSYYYYYFTITITITIAITLVLASQIRLSRLPPKSTFISLNCLVWVLNHLSSPTFTPLLYKMYEIASICSSQFSMSFLNWHLHASVCTCFLLLVSPSSALVYLRGKGGTGKLRKEHVFLFWSFQITYQSILFENSFSSSNSNAEHL